VTIFGWDASHYDAPPNAAKVISEGFSFMTHKVGGDGNDMEADDYWRAVKPYRATHVAVDANGQQYFARADGSRGLLVGAYWIVRPDLHSSPTADADQFLARLDAMMPGWRDAPFILQADAESWGDSSGRKKPNMRHLKAFGDRLKAKVPKLRMFAYASRGDYGDGLSGLGYPLWNANYAMNYVTGTASGIYARCGGDSGPGWHSYSGQVPEIWQFSSSITIAGQTTCDANAFRGTADQLIALLAPGWAPKPPVKGTTMNLSDKVNSAVYPNRTVENFFADFWGVRDVVVGDSKAAAPRNGSPLAEWLALPAQVAALTAAVQAPAPVDLTDEQLQGIADKVADRLADVLAARLKD